MEAWNEGNLPNVAVPLFARLLFPKETGIDNQFARKWELSVHGGWSD